MATIATAIFPNFPYSIDDEPTEDWTVEQVLQLCLLRSHKATDDKYLELVHQLKAQMEQGKKEIQQCQKKALEGHNNSSTAENNHTSNDKTNTDCVPMEEEKVPMAAVPVPETKNNPTTSSSVADSNKQEEETKTKTPMVVMKNNPGNPASVVHIEVIGGHYDGQKFKLQPKVRYPCWIGRSTGKKFRERGISLSKDLEVSTTHGKFELVDGILCFTDTGSTNGSKLGGTRKNNFVDGNEIQPNHPIPLSIGLLFTVGQTTLKVEDFD